MKKKSTYYLVGNAHLDPVWQWRWQEGSAEAKATLRSALDRMKEFPEYVFVCSSASVFQWVEEFVPEMFEEIKQRVAEGRFVIVGGMHVQPDCNNPSGEGFARQTLYAQRYFKEKLGVTAKVGYNVDSFGHNLMLPQILKKSGMDDYIFMRPGEHEKHMDSDLFHWVSPDGSSVMAHRLFDYGRHFKTIEELERHLEDLNNHTITDLDMCYLFYGVGNHGGGPTILNLQLLRQYQQEHPEIKMIYSNVTDLFDKVRESGITLPEHHDDLQHHAAGCYATVSSLKNGVRRGENNLSAAENFTMLANLLCKKPYNSKAFEEAWKNICFLHFHDSMGGCSIPEVYEDAAYQYGMSLNTAAVAENNALQTISWQIDTNHPDWGIPLVIFNPHSFDVEELVKANIWSVRAVKDSQGNDVPFQRIYASSETCFETTVATFKAKVPALGYAVYYVYERFIPNKERFPDPLTVDGGLLKVVPYTDWRTANNHKGTVLENDILRVEFELHTGYILSMVDKRTGKELLSDRAAVPVVVDEYYHDTWSHVKTFFVDRMARFSDAEVTVTEGGPLRATVKVVSHYNKSTLTQYFSLEPGSDHLSVRAEVDWREKHKVLKLAWPMNVENPKAYYEIPFGVIERPVDGEEEPGLMWTAVKGDNGGFAICNSDTYSSSVEGSTIYHTILRSPIYADHGGPRTSESQYTEQGVRRFQYVLMPVGDSWAPVIRTAKLLNKPTTTIMETWHGGKFSDQPYSALQISADNVVLSACKRSEDGTGMILRLYETDGKHTPVTVSGDLVRVPLNVTFSPWSMRTYYLGDDALEWKEVLITEYDM